ncbi:MAG: ribonuclease H-like domain-containing protein [Lachnospiraceae bacterium]|nr:ribonuclease H-like domain-containing protein [Lachnospiraceae bacterium]
MEVYRSFSDESELFIKTTDIMFPDVEKEQILIYDIDTTSFEAANGCIFLIGVMYYQNEQLYFTQFFSESIDEEALIIEKFFDIAENYKILLSYKGESFDIPYIGKRLYALKQNELYSRFTALRSSSVDIANEIMSVKNALGFSSTKLDYLRKKCGQTVPERVSGENISRFYVEHIAASKLRKLLETTGKAKNCDLISNYNPKPVIDDLAHIKPDSGDRFLTDILYRNKENIESVIYLLRLSRIFSMRKGRFDVTVDAFSDAVSNEHSITDNYDTIHFDISSSDYRLRLPVTIVSLSLKQFYPNYKDYYYFPAEDMAVHKSIAEFAAAGSKKKATAKTAYRNVSGRFIHIPSGFAKSESNKDSNFYKTDYESEEHFLPVDELSGIKETEKIKELAYYLFLEYASSNLKHILM